MNDIQPAGQSAIETKIKEAETCHSMGMMAEALQVYEQVLANLPGKDGQIRETISARIKLLKKDIENQEETDSQGVTPEDISIFKKTLSSHDDVPTLLDGAAALKELGLMEEAIAEYDKLLEFDYSKFDYSETDYSPIKIVCDYLTFLLEVKAPQDVIKDAYRVIYKQNIREKETAQVKFWLGLQLEKRITSILPTIYMKQPPELIRLIPKLSRDLIL
jgi:tetratricopeptide (TPR) repeat protein